MSVLMCVDAYVLINWYVLYVCVYIYIYIKTEKEAKVIYQKYKEKAKIIKVFLKRSYLNGYVIILLISFW